MAGWSFALLGRFAMIGAGIGATGPLRHSEAAPTPAFGVVEAVRPPTTVAILLYHGVDLLDVAGPARVFTHAFDSDGRPLFEVAGVASDVHPVGTLGIAKIVPRHDLVDVAAPDVLVIPGGMVESLLDDDEAMRWIDSCCAAKSVVLSIGSGASVLGRLKRLDGRRVATHHDHAPRLAVVAPTAVFVPDARFIDHGSLITAAGATGGIDAALHLVARIEGTPTARRVATDIEYDSYVGHQPSTSRVLADEGPDGPTLHGQPYCEVAGQVTELVTTITSRGVEAAVQQHAAMMAAAEPVDRPLLGKESIALTADWLRRYGTDPGEAIAVMRFNAHVHPRFVPGHLQLAEMLLASGDEAGAATACKRALAIDPRCEEARLLLERCAK
jgi:putative intracellular protease/amidase